MRLLVTGAGGFIGGRLASLALRAGTRGRSRRSLAETWARAFPGLGIPEEAW